MTADAWRRWDLHPSVLIGLALLGGLYVSWGGLRAPRRQVAAFAAALTVLFVCLNGPLHNLSDAYLFSAHMVQHLALMLLFPPLLLYGTPPSVVERVLRPAWVRRTAVWATRPLVAGAIFTVPIVAWHFPRAYNAALVHHDLHIVQHLVFLATAVVMWCPVLSPLPALRAPQPVQLSVVGALITLADGVLYPFYETAPRVWGLSPLADQQIGGLIMWVPGGLIFWLAMTVVWFRWAARDTREDATLPPASPLGGAS